MAKKKFKLIQIRQFCKMRVGYKQKILLNIITTHKFNFMAYEPTIVYVFVSTTFCEYRYSTFCRVPIHVHFVQYMFLPGTGIRFGSIRTVKYTFREYTHRENRFVNVLYYLSHKKARKTEPHH
jgi:hypothetical protein